MKTIHYLQHVPFENPGNILNWANDHGYRLSASRLYEDASFPEQHDFDWLVVMGGPMSTCDTQQYPWLVAEKAFIEQTIAQGKIVLGICLGAQLIAEVLGAKVYPNKEKEIGWFPIKWTSQAHQSSLFNHVPEEMMVFHWHGDTFDLPEGSVHIASSVACQNQAFTYRDHVVALQFHIEMTQTEIDGLLHHSADEMVESPYIQSGNEIRKYNDALETTQHILYGLLDRLKLY